MTDGIGQTGAGFDDRRLAGMDLQHNTQTLSTGKLKAPKRILTHEEGSGGPMKEHMDHEGHQQHHMHQHLEEEKNRHAEAMEHQKYHLERHHERPFNSQHGQDHHKY